MDSKEQRYSPPKLPPKSRFNEQESTAVLRLLLQQEKLLKNKEDNPALRLTPENSGRHLPPVTAELREEGKQKENMSKITNKEFSHYNRKLPTCISGQDTGRPATAGGIYQSPKLARAKERPKGSYGRRQEPQDKQQHETQQQHPTTNLLRPQSRRHEERERKHSHQETIANLKEQTLKLGVKKTVARTHSCPVQYESHIPPISAQNKQSMNWLYSTPALTNSMSDINLKSGGQGHERR